MGQIDKIDARTDVYALGAILYQILSGRAPFIGTSGIHILKQVLIGPPVSLHTFTADEFFGEGASGPSLPEELVAACERAMSRNPNERYQSVTELAEEIEAWLEGSKKREQALKVVEEALQTNVEATDLKEKAAGMRAEAEARLKEIPAWEAEEVKAPHWAVEDEAAALEQQAQLLRITREQKLQGALTHKSDLPEAHVELAAQYRAEHDLPAPDQSKSSKPARLRNTSMHCPSSPRQGKPFRLSEGRWSPVVGDIRTRRRRCWKSSKCTIVDWAGGKITGQDTECPSLWRWGVIAFVFEKKAFTECCIQCPLVAESIGMPFTRYEKSQPQFGFHL